MNHAGHCDDPTLVVVSDSLTRRWMLLYTKEFWSSQSIRKPKLQQYQYYTQFFSTLMSPHKKFRYFRQGHLPSPPSLWLNQFTLKSDRFNGDIVRLSLLLPCEVVSTLSTLGVLLLLPPFPNFLSVLLQGLFSVNILQTYICFTQEPKKKIPHNSEMFLFIIALYWIRKGIYLLYYLFKKLDK